MAYSNTLSASFHLDDRDYITGNPWFKNFTLWPDQRQFQQGNSMISTNVTDTLRTRYIAYLTLYGNIKANGLNVQGFHVVNIAIHVVNAFLVYMLVFLTLRTPRMPHGPTSDGTARIIALFAALIFAGHPLQTQAVTYISQRFASLVALFYMAATVAYIKWRLNEEKGVYYFSALILAMLAMMTKETAFTLPVAIVLYEFVFFDDKKTRQRLIALIPFLMTMLIIPLLTFSTGAGIGEAAKRAAGGLSRLDYFITQLTVIPHYLRLLVYPAGQNFDYNYPVYHTFADKTVILSALFLIAILIGSAIAFKTGRKGRPAMLLIAYGIWWFFITLSVESSIFPLNDMIFEHRAYLPSVGIIMAFTMGLFMTAGQSKTRMLAVMVIAGAVVIALGVSAFARNAVWKDEVTLWQDTVKKSPQKRRPHYNLSMAYRAAGMKEQAVAEYKTAMGLAPDYIGEIYGVDEGMEETIDDNIIEHYRKVLGVDADLSEVYNKFGLMYENRRNFDKAIELYTKALKENPASAPTYANLGNAYRGKGMAREAGKYYIEAIRRDPKMPEPHNNLGVLYIESNMPKEALREFEAVLAINPDFPMARQMRDYVKKMIR